MVRRLAVLLAAASMAAVVACSQSDPGITTAVKSKLTADDTVKAYQIDVDTKDRVVTLSGTVETGAQRDQAVLLARQTDGVREVVDQITVNADTAPTTGNLRDEAAEEAREARQEGREAAARSGDVISDAAVTSAVKSKFLADTTVAGLKIDVDTRDGAVSLNGTVSSKAEADRAVALARETDGVKRVVSNLTIRR